MMTMPRIEDPRPLTFVPDIQFGEADGQPLLLDLFAPQSPPDRPRPAMIWLHGGGWFLGTRRGSLETAMCALLASEGFVAVSAEYRLSGEATFPAQIHDVKAAIRWLRANAGSYGIDPDHIGIGGASAGGGLASLAGLTGDLPELEGDAGSPSYSSRIQAVVVASSPSDFLRPGGEMRNDTDGPVPQLFGGTIATKRDLMRLGSPITHVGPGTPPFLIAHGTLDETVPFEQGQWLYEALVDAGATAEFFPLEGLYHNWLREVESEIPGREDTWKLGPMALPFLRRHLAL